VNTTDQPTPQQPSPEVRKLMQEYERLAHGMMTGVGYVNQLDPAQSNAKHVRVGVNCALVSHAALVRVLMAKGVITDLEYWTAIVEGMRDEVDNYSARLKELTGGKTDFTLL